MAHEFSRDRLSPCAETTKGIVRGYRYDGLTVFKGIPYATARRFHAPRPTEPWEGILDACSYGDVCPLLEKENPKGEVLIPHRYWPMSENCLNLNVWTPGTDDKKRPVLVWLHGGGFSAGSAIEQVAYDGANMARLGDAVVVSVNHRLNILGYFDLSEYGGEYANSANAGGDDIITALRWIHDNIAAFGGDPDNVTVFGQSGGGAKVTALLQSPAADGLYHRGVVMSGVYDRMSAESGSSRDIVEALMKELRIKNVKKLETVDYGKLAKAYRKVSPPLEKAGKYVGCVPRKNAFFHGDPCVHPFRQETKDIPLLVGTVFGEFTSFTQSPYDREAMAEREQIAYIEREMGKENARRLIPLFRRAYPRRQVIDLLRLDWLFRLPQISYVRKRAGLNGCTWTYLFNMDQPIDGGSTPWHCSDIPYFFHNLELVEYPHGRTEPAGLSLIHI